MKATAYSALGAMALGALTLTSTASAQDQDARDTDAIIANCFSAPPDADRAIVRNVCLRAFDGAVKQAQRSDVHSQSRQNLYWAQASQAAGILVVLFVELEGGFDRRACTTAYRGWQSWNQIDPEFKKAGSGFNLSNALQASVSHCQAQWDRGEWR